MRIRAACRVLLALAAAWPIAALAYRPFDSTDAAVADRGELELELGPLGYLARGADGALVAPSVTLNWGFARRWEAVLEGRQLVQLDSEVGEPRERVEDVALSLKHVLREGSLQGQPGVSVATELGALLPTFHDEPGLGVEWTLIVSRRWADLTVHLDGTIAWTRAHEPAGFGGLIVEGPDRWVIRPVAELSAGTERGAPATVAGLVGAIWRFSERLSVDAAVRRGRADGIRTTEIRLGLTWAIAVGFPR